MSDKTTIKPGTKVKAIPKPKPEIGIDTKDKLVKDLVDAADVSTLDVNKIETFTTVAQSRDQIYSTIDLMSQDSTLSAVLETYAEDTVETNDQGQVMWCESSSDDVLKYVTYILKDLRIDKNLYNWSLRLIKYGDLYLRLYRQSDYDKDDIFKNDSSQQDRNEQNSIGGNSLNEDINLKMYSKKDHYIHYVEAAYNPSELFELTRFGKTMGFIEAPISIQNSYDNPDTVSGVSSLLTYKWKQKDVTIHGPMDFVHICMEDNSSRLPEEVSLYMADRNMHSDDMLDDSFNDNNNDDENNAINYKVKKGQSLFADVFKVWRQLTLLENSILLSRVTRSSIVRILNIDTGDMPNEQVRSFVQRLKEKIEQKSALDADKSMNEYTNPGPIENTLYIPTHGTQGNISAQTLGGDVDPKQLTDLSYFQDKMFGSLRIPKQYFGITDDSAGFNGGTSLSIISSRYGKAIKRIQNTLCQGITDIINIFLLDVGFDSYIGKFTIRMQAPITQEEIDRRSNNDNRVRYVSDVMQQLTDLESPTAKLKILTSLLSSVVNDPETISILQKEVKKMEKKDKNDENDGLNKEKKDKQNEEEMNDLASEPLPNFEDNSEDNMDMENTEDEQSSEEENTEDNDLNNMPLNNKANQELNNNNSTETSSENEEQSYMPNPGELGIDMTKNS